MHRNIVVIIAIGGEGKRLKEITNDIPKPLYPVAGQSTLYRCCYQLAKYNFKKIILTLGFCPEKFSQPIKEISSKLNLEIKIHQEQTPLGECGAIWELEDNLSQEFLFINGDLIFEIDFDKFLNFHKRLDSELTLITHVSTHPKDSDLVNAPNGTQIENLFFKSSRNHNIKKAYLGNAGISLISKNLIKEIRKPKNLSQSSVFNHIVLNAKIMNKRIYSYNTTEYIKDMGTPNRLKEVSKAILEGLIHKKCYINKQKALFIDRDNTIIECANGKYIITVKDIKFMFKNIENIINLAKDFDFICLITNQPQVSMGLISTEELDNIHSFIITNLIDCGLKIDVVAYCPHHPHKGFKNEISILKTDCFCRKPNPGMILEQAYSRNIDLSKSLVIGDSNIDELAAKNAGCSFKNINSI